MNPPPSRSDVSALLKETGWARELAMRLVRDADRADDLVQEAYLQALVHRPDGQRSLRGWFATVLTNLVRQDRRSEGHRKQREQAAARQESLPSTLDSVERFALHRDLVQAVHELREPYRSTLVQRFFEERSPAAIARLSGIPVSTVKTRLARGLEQLRQRLDEQKGGDGRSWALALIPLIERPGGSAATALGAIAVSTQVKLALAAIAVVTGVAIIWPDGLQPVEGLETETALASQAALTKQDSEPEQRGVALAAAGEQEVQRGAIMAPPITPAAKAEPSKEWPTRSVQGLVLDAEGRPRAGVPLTLVTGFKDNFGVGAMPSTSSGAGGSFLFEGVQRGGRVVASGTRWRTLFHGRLSMDESAGDPLVIVAPRIELAGAVVDELGQPLAGVRLSLSLPSSFASRFDVALTRAGRVPNLARSDDEGRFELPASAAVLDSRLLVNHPGYVSLDLESPQTSNTNLRLVMRRPSVVDGTLHGRVVDLTGQGVPHAEVAYGLEATAADAQGFFSFQMEPEGGSINQEVSQFAGVGAPQRLMAMKPGLISASLTVEPDEEDGLISWPDDIVLTMGGPPLTLKGRVEDQAGVPMAGVQVWLDDVTVFSLGQGGMRLVESHQADSERRWNFVETDSSGRFELKGLSDREYRVAAMNPRTLMLSKASGLQAGTSGHVIVLDSAKAWREVAGQVLDKHGNPLVDVSVSPQSDSFQVKYMGETLSTSHGGADGTRTDEDGYFYLYDVPMDVVYLRVVGEQTIKVEYGRSAEGGLAALSKGEIEELVIVVPLRMLLQVELNSPDQGDAVGVLDSNGDAMLVDLVQGGSTNHTRQVSLVNGRSPVITLTDKAESLVLFKDGVEVKRTDLHLQTGDVNRVRM